MENHDRFIGHKFNRWTVLGIAPRSLHSRKDRYFCRCDCGTERIVVGGSLVNGMSKSCGCVVKEMNQARTENVVGQKFGRLTAIERVGTAKHSRNSVWRFRCDCGKEKVAQLNLVKSGNTMSCGCLHHDRVVEKNTVHGFGGANKDRLYYLWSNMKTRCLNPNFIDYAIYGGRGIKVCDEWLNDFAAFRRDILANIGYPPTIKHSLDRVDTNGFYTPSNVRWSTPKEQQNNRRNNILVDLDGTVVPFNAACDQFSLPYKPAYDLLRKGLSMREVINALNQRGGTQKDAPGVNPDAPVG